MRSARSEGSIPGVLPVPGFSKRCWWWVPLWSQRFDLVTAENTVLAFDRSFGNCFDPYPGFWLGEQLPASIRIPVPEQRDEASRDGLGSAPVPAGNEKVECPPVGGAAAMGLESYFFGNHAGDSDMKFGVET